MAPSVRRYVPVLMSPQNRDETEMEREWNEDCDD